MGIVIKDSIYFDVTSRTDKALMLQALAVATKKANPKNKAEIAKELVDALKLFRTKENGAYGRTQGVGSYDGNTTQFDSQYTPGLEFGLWGCTKSEYRLSRLGELLSEEKVSSENYISIVMFNYIQIIRNEIVSPLEECLNMCVKNNNIKISSNDILINKKLVDPKMNSTDKDKKYIKQYCNLLFNILSETIYFKRISNRYIEFNGDIESAKQLIEIINHSKIQEVNDEIISELEERELFSEYLTRVNLSLCKYFSKYHSINIDYIYKEINHENINRINDTKGFDLVEDTEMPKFCNHDISYSNKTKKIDYIEKNKRQIIIGNAAEKLVYEKERERIANIDSSLVNHVKWISKELGDGIGYDISSIEFDENGKIVPIYIEVKATTGSKNTPIEITRNEVECSKKFNDNYRIYRIYNFNSEIDTIKYYEIKGDITRFSLEPVKYRMYIE